MNEHLPFVLPVVFATTINNMLWSIGMEVTLERARALERDAAHHRHHDLLGQPAPGPGGRHLVVAGCSIVVAIILFLGLYLLFSSVNEYIDPRTRLRLIGG